MRRDAATAVVETLVAAALWGTSFPVISVAIRDGLNPVLFVFLRFALAAPLMLLVAAFMGKRIGPLLHDRAVWIIAFLNAVGFLCQFVGQEYTQASIAALLVNLSVAFAAIGGTVFLKERLGPLKVIGVILALVGTLLLATGGNLSGLNEGQVAGDLLYLGSAASWAGYIIYAKKRTDEANWDPVAASAAIVALTGLFFIPPVLLSIPSAAPSVGSWEAIIYTAVFNTAIPFVLYQAGLRELSAAGSAVVLMMQIIVAMMISVAFLGETLTPPSVLGAVAVLTSILMASGLEAGGKSLSVGQNDGLPVQVQN